jgi:putative acetyltransferase
MLYAPGLLAQQGFNDELSTTNWCGLPYPAAGIPPVDASELQEPLLVAVPPPFFATQKAAVEAAGYEAGEGFVKLPYERELPTELLKAPACMDEYIAEADSLANDVRELIARHLRFTGAATSAEFAFALDHDELVEPGVTLFGLRANGELLAVGALRHLDHVHAELKSMHTAEEARGRGLGRRMLEHLIATARARGYRRVSLETGSTESRSERPSPAVATKQVSCP